MVLLHLLHALAPRHGWRLTVAHFNHHLRGRSSDADERLVRRTAKKLDLSFVSGHADVRSFSRTHHISLEMAARKARHDFLARTAERLGIPTVALAHHADDQLELFFLRLFRGSGGEGLSGMKWMAPSPARVRSSALRRLDGNRPSARLKVELQTCLVRPLLDVPKAVLEKFAQENEVPFREDASNDNLDIQRNRIRRELLPLIRRKYQPALDRTVLRSMDIAGAEAEFIGECAAEWLARKRPAFSTDAAKLLARQPARGDARPTSHDISKTLQRTRFADLPVPVQRRCIQLQLLHHGIATDYELMERLRLRPGRPIAVSPQSTIMLSGNGLLRFKTTKLVGSSAFRRTTTKDRLTRAAPEGSPRREAELRTTQGRIVFGGLEIRWKIEAWDGSIPRKVRGGCEFFDADAVGSELILRHWQPGDRFQPIGMSRGVKLQDLFTNQRIPRMQRHQLVVVTTVKGELVWVEELRISERFKLFKRTNRRLQWRWKRL